MSRSPFARACIGFGALGLVSSAVALAGHTQRVSSVREQSRAAFDQHLGEAGEMVSVAATAYIRAFQIDKTEVTVRSYRSCVEQGACSAPSTGELCNWGKPDKDSHPINCVDHDQATTFCAWAGRRLPAADEWELAGCRFQTYPWPGSDFQQVGCVDREARWAHLGPISKLVAPALGTCAVDAHPEASSPSGAIGMGDNVSEWTATEPREAGADSHRFVHKGGSWIVPLSWKESFQCGKDSLQAPHFRDSSLGFRCARSEERSLARDLFAR